MYAAFESAVCSRLAREFVTAQRRISCGRLTEISRRRVSSTSGQLQAGVQGAGNE